MNVQIAEAYKVDVESILQKTGRSLKTFSFKLPTKFFIAEDTPEKYHKFKGVPMTSYSQTGSASNIDHLGDYIRTRFYRVKKEGFKDKFGDYGTSCGEYIEWLGNGSIGDAPESKSRLSHQDKKFLEALDYPDNCFYEDVVVIPVVAKGTDEVLFVVKGAIDRSIYSEDNKAIDIVDFKTGNIDKKVEFYESPEYQQTTLYCGCKEMEGFKINSSGVVLLSRRGNNTSKSGPLRLDNNDKTVNTPYSIERFQQAMEELVENAIKIVDIRNTLIKLGYNPYEKREIVEIKMKKSWQK